MKVHSVGDAVELAEENGEVAVCVYMLCVVCVRVFSPVCPRLCACIL